MATCPSPSDMYLQADQRETLVTPGDFENVRGKLCNDDSGQRKKRIIKKFIPLSLCPCSQQGYVHPPGSSEWLWMMTDTTVSYPAETRALNALATP